MWPPAPAANTFAIGCDPPSARGCRRRGGLPECALYSWCSVVHLEEGLHDPDALVLGHIIVDRQREHTVGTSLASRQRHIMARGVGAHLVTWRAVILSGVQGFLWGRCRLITSGHPAPAFIAAHPAGGPRPGPTVGRPCDRDDREG